MRKVPKELSHNQYCLPCFSTKIRSEVLAYRQTMKKAKDIIFLDKPRRRPLRILRRSEIPLLVQNCADREETVMRLAFQAAELGFESVIKADVNYKKVRNEGYQKMVWTGTGIAATLDMSIESLDT
jgi:hypothetical protein